MSTWLERLLYRLDQARGPYYLDRFSPPPPMPPRAVGPYESRGDREYVGLLLTLVEGGHVITHPHICGDGYDSWGTRTPGQPASYVRHFPGAPDDPHGDMYWSGQAPNGGRAAIVGRRLLELKWVALGDVDEHGARPVTLTELGAGWLTYCRGNFTDLDLSRVRSAHAAVEAARAEFRVYCEDRGIDHGHQDVDR